MAVPRDLRPAVIRRMRYGLNTIALESDRVPPEGPFDVALTNGLLAIVASIDPTQTLDPTKSRPDRLASARLLLERTHSLGVTLPMADLLDALNETQPLRHGSSDDEWVTPTPRHLDALQALDAHDALNVLDLAREHPTVNALVPVLYYDAALDASGQAYLSPKESLDVFDPQDCNDCWRPTFIMFSNDDFGGDEGPGVCLACGAERTADESYEMASATEMNRVFDRDRDR